jgi:hypothetical protein
MIAWGDTYAMNQLNCEASMLDLETGLRAYATMMNTLDAGAIEPLLADDFHYSSQWVLVEITSKQAYLEYIHPKLKAVRESGTKVWAEMAQLERGIPGPCVVLAQESKDSLLSLVLGKVANGKLTRLDMCGAPSPWSAKRSGEYPGLPA